MQSSGADLGVDGIRKKTAKRAARTPVRVAPFTILGHHHIFHDILLMAEKHFDMVSIDVFYPLRIGGGVTTRSHGFGMAEKWTIRTCSKGNLSR